MPTADTGLVPDLKHHCGLFGIVNHPDAAQLTYYGLFALQHRGQEAAGICGSDGKTIERRHGMGLVAQAFRKEDLQALGNSFLAIGHTRYSTTGSCSEANIQPFVLMGGRGPIAIAHNGNLVNAGQLRREYEERGTLFATTSDTEVIPHMLADPRYAEHPDPLAAVCRRLRGSFCLLLLHADRIEAVRDSTGNRPLCLGKIGDAHVVASETSALDVVGAKFVREVEPGEIVTLDVGGVTSRRFVAPEDAHPAHCIFEHIYFADPASEIFGESVHDVRREMGRQLAREAPADADLIIEVPNSGRCAALGFHEQSGIPLGRGFTTNHYAGRSFIRPSQKDRDLTVRMKLNVIKSQVAGKRLVVIEDSVVRGTTTRGKMEALRAAGAKEIHLRVASPPIRHPCYYGIDFPRSEELIAHERTVEQVRAALAVDSLAYLSVEGMLKCVRRPPTHYCTACFSGQYPIPVEAPMDKEMFERQLTFFKPVGALEQAMKS
jgi:amidophosphoribosyltransferase